MVNPADTWSVSLLCPYCGRPGVALVFESSERLRVATLTPGFSTVERTRGPDIKCIDCNLSVIEQARRKARRCAK
jgi:hypothetical protein